MKLTITAQPSSPTGWQQFLRAVELEACAAGCGFDVQLHRLCWRQQLLPGIAQQLTALCCWLPRGTADPLLLPQDGAGDLVTADDGGTLCVWSSGEEFSLLNRIPAFG